MRQEAGHIAAEVHLRPHLCRWMHTCQSHTILTVCQSHMPASRWPRTRGRLPSLPLLQQVEQLGVELGVLRQLVEQDGLLGRGGQRARGREGGRW